MKLTFWRDLVQPRFAHLKHSWLPLVLLPFLPISAFGVQEGDFEYQLVLNRVQITRYTGPGVISNRVVGIALFAAPENFRPSWFHNRDYGLMVANPFGRQAFTKGEASRVEVAKGSTFTLRAGYFVHSSPVGKESERTKAYQQFVPNK